MNVPRGPESPVVGLQFRNHAQLPTVVTIMELAPPAALVESEDRPGVNLVAGVVSSAASSCGREASVIVAPLPAVWVINARLPILEVVAIAAAVIALVLWLNVPEAVWLLVLVLAASRRRMMDSGLDPVLRDRRCPRCAQPRPAIRRS